jgi:CheY-like chemotaxis protein
MDPRFPSGLSILVAEDNAINQQVILLMLRKLGFSPILVGNGRLALEAVRRGGIDLVLMDCQMPEMDGYEATRGIRLWEREQGGPRVPVIAITAHAMGEDRDHCLAAGMDEYLTKPLRIGELAGAIRKWLDAPPSA